jgi:YD repeat-containing protein
VSPADVVATIYHALGLEPHTLMYDPLGRPMTITDGKAISQLF